MTGPVPAAGIVEAAAKAIYNSWWEDGEPDESARWENLEPDDDDRLSALKAARVALKTGLPMAADQIEGRTPIWSATFVRSLAEGLGDEHDAR